MDEDEGAPSQSGRAGQLPQRGSQGGRGIREAAPYGDEWDTSSVTAQPCHLPIKGKARDNIKKE